MTKPTIEDLRVSRWDASTLDVSSDLTGGVCATVFFADNPPRPLIVPFLIPSYMQGITPELIGQAVQHFLQQEAAAASAAPPNHHD
ncbi:hypothetical protein ACI2UK_24390 [Ralstonia nicotianae]|uniref:hypothetical protein n=1 Tax=Ralstonia pseudosolanacearum TaxID=1310165 RepID=UPI0020040CCE|nr:hypothetical protein [Ralstonia pseudosolanacearum]MCK4120418.1 hypothetical protein [Ralstonia pseudosolanacearum]